MALQRRLLVGLASASSLLLVYILCLRLEAPLSVAPFKRPQALINQSQSSTSFGFDSLDNVQSRINKESSALRRKETSEEAKEEMRKGDEEMRRGNEEEKVDMRGGDKETKEETRRGDEEDRDTEAHGTAKDNSTAKNTTTTTATLVRARTTKPGTKPGSEPGLKPGSEPGLKPGSEPGLKPGSEPGLKPGLKPGLLPGLKPGPTEPPFIGDLYYSEERPPLKDCPRSIRRLVQHTDFKTRFRPDIPVLQWSKHLSQDQYQRLRQYPGAHGWAGVSYETLVDVLTSSLDTPQSGLLLDDLSLSSSSFTSSRSNSSLCVRCAVVGNGGILKDSKKGPEIDQHHYVFRTNGAIIRGFEEDVGSRTTHYIFSTNTLRNSLRSYRGAGYNAPPHTQETRYVFLPDHDRDYLLLKAAATHTRVQRGPERDIDPAQFFGSDVTKEKLKMYHPDFIRYIRNRFLRSNALKTKYKDLYRPSTGAVMLLSALHQCDQVSAYGFMTPDFSRFSDHYFDQKFHSVGFFINHDLRLEMSLWQQLHQQGLLRLYMRPESEPGLNRV